MGRRRAGIGLVSPGLARVMLGRIRGKHWPEPVVAVSNCGEVKFGVHSM